MSMLAGRSWVKRSTIRAQWHPWMVFTTSPHVTFNSFLKRPHSSIKTYFAATNRAFTSLSGRIQDANDSTVSGKRSSSSALALVTALTTAFLMLLPSYRTNDAHIASTEALVTNTTSVSKSDDSHDYVTKLQEGTEEDETTTLLNWSGTRSITIPTSHFYEPENIQELEQIVHHCYVTNTPFRPTGSMLSPNGISFHHRHGNTTGVMISLVHLNKVIEINKEKMTVTVQAGARVSQVIDALRPYGLTLPNLASIAEQQIGGFIQVGAHGTGASIPPVDDFCTTLKLLTTHMGTLTLSASSTSNNKPTASFSSNPLFDLVKVGLGSLGIVTEVTLTCIPAHNLVEHTFVLTRKQACEQINSLLKCHKHVRYMWIPYQDAVVVVTNDVEVEGDVFVEPSSSAHHAKQKKEYQFEPLTELLMNTNRTFSKEQVQDLGFGELRDQLLAIDPLNLEHVKLCNKAEAEFWRRSQGWQVKPSDELLQFDCGGQQWVWEVCFPTGCYHTNNGNDIKFMQELLQGIEQHECGIAAHAPIEQRWSSSSSSLMSPAYSPRSDGMHCWVGIIMYLPTDDKRQCEDISQTFQNDYCNLMKRVGSNVNATSHWAKLEIPNSPQDVQELQQLIRSRYPVDYFNFARYTLDPTHLLSNDIINVVFGSPTDALFTPPVEIGGKKKEEYSN